MSGDIPPPRRIEVLETSGFQRWVRKERVRRQVAELIDRLRADPAAGDVMPGSGGLRKVRMPRPGGGKRGGYRVIYVILLGDRYLGLVAGYDKAGQENPSPDQLRAFSVAARVLEDRLRAALAAEDPSAGSGE